MEPVAICNTREATDTAGARQQSVKPGMAKPVSDLQIANFDWLIV